MELGGRARGTYLRATLVRDMRVGVRAREDSSACMHAHILALKLSKFEVGKGLETGRSFIP
jgi:hypothetical protein